MRLRTSGGELVLGLAFVATGVFWIAVAAGKPLWEGFAPASGFLPLVYGVLLAVLAVCATATDVAARGQDAAAPPPVGRALLIVLTVCAGTAGIEVVGFATSMFLALLFLFRVVERKSLPAALAVAAFTAGALSVIFHTWLGVPLPAGPLGF